MSNKTSHQLKIMEIEKITLLIIDDEPGVLRTLKSSLHRHYHVLTTEKKDEVWEILSQETVHIIICDERMREIKGSDLLSEVRQKYPQVVRILLSGYTDLSTLQDAINKARVFKFVAKPWDLDELKTVLEEAHEFFEENRSNQYVDTITELKSTVALNDILDAEIQRCTRYHHPLSTVMIGLKDLSLLHKVHGFQVGEQILKKIAEIVCGELRASDLAGRLDEDVFLVILTETDYAGSKVFIDRCMSMLNDASVETEDGPIKFQVAHSSFTLDEKITPSVHDVLEQLYLNLQ